MYLCSLAVVVESNVTSVAAGELTSMRHITTARITSHPMLGGSLSPQHGTILGLWIEERPPTMKGSCKYIEKAAADKRQGVVLQLGGLVWG
jgi:hypothetical protein